jgi:sterol desaturase/sphingolipid hydroxylase (fatty acid hydroxylase superfamily)
LTVAATVWFLAAERLLPGRELPKARGWYARALVVNGAQFAITIVAWRLWAGVFEPVSLFHLAEWNEPVLEGGAAWFVGTFVFYWWHRLRHWRAFWRVFHQVHHSPSRIEIVTSFYKHPIEIAADSVLSIVMLYALLGCSVDAGLWYNFFAATGEYFYHANLRTPYWMRYIIQTPELHSVHHQYDVHHYNYADIPLWDRLFGTYCDAIEFAPRCGFPHGAEQRLSDMLAFRDVYRSAEELLTQEET